MKPAAVLVTGANGFVGQHLVRTLASRDWRVIATARDAEPAQPITGHIDEYIACDLRRAQVDVPADAIVHLAGLAAVGPSFDSPQAYIASNTAMTTNVLEPATRRGGACRVLVVSTGAVYAGDQGLPISEEGATFPTSPYAVSKLAVEEQARYYSSRGSRVLVARPFNHIGPGQSQGFLVPDLIAKIREAIQSGLPLTTNNLDSQRDYTDVRDVVAAYADLLESRDARSYETVNVCSGVATSGEEILTILLRITGQAALARTSSRASDRPNDPSIVRGDGSRLRQMTGWVPKIPLADSLRAAWEDATQ